MYEKEDARVNSAPLEKEFRAAVETAQAEIERHMKAARNALNKALEVSEKHGVPFYVDVSFIS